MMKNNTGLKWIFNNSKKMIPAVSILILINSAIAILGIVLVLFSKNLIDAAVAGIRQDVQMNGIYLALVLVLQLILKNIYLRIEMHVQAKSDIDYKNNLIILIFGKEYSNIAGYHSGDILNRLTTDIRVITEGITGILPNVVAVVIKTIGIFIVLFWMEPHFTIIFLVAGILIFVISLYLRKIIKKLHKYVQETDGKLRSFLHEMLNNLLVIRIFSNDKWIFKKVDRLQEDSYNAKMKRRTAGMVANTGFTFVFQIGYMYALVWCAFGLLNKSITYGTLTAILQLVSQIQTPFMSLSAVMPKYFEMIASAERLMEFENLDDGKVNEVCDKKISSVVFDNVTFSYEKEVVLSNVSFEVPFGKNVMITGDSGAGKSTLMKLMLGIYRPDSGKVCLKYEDGSMEEICGIGHSGFTYVPQGNTLFSGTVRENVAMFNESISDDVIWESLKLGMADEFITQSPDKLDTLLGERGMGLSEGQLQRLCISRAFASGKRIVLFDEATSALDKATERKLFDSIKNMEDYTFFIITHRVDTCDICDITLNITNKEVECRME